MSLSVRARTWAGVWIRKRHARRYILGEGVAYIFLRVLLSNPSHPSRFRPLKHIWKSHELEISSHPWSNQIILLLKIVIFANLMGASSHDLGAYITVREDDLLRLCSSSSSSLYVFLLLYFFLVSLHYLSTASIISWELTFVKPINRLQDFY